MGFLILHHRSGIPDAVMHDDGGRLCSAVRREGEQAVEGFGMVAPGVRRANRVGDQSTQPLLGLSEAAAWGGPVLCRADRQAHPYRRRRRPVL